MACISMIHYYCVCVWKGHLPFGVWILSSNIGAFHVMYWDCSNPCLARVLALVEAVTLNC